MLARTILPSFGLLIPALLFYLAAGSQEPIYRTTVTRDGRGIVRHPGPGDFHRGALTQIPVYQPGKTELFKVDLRGYDLRALNLDNRLADLVMADFDDRTK